MISKNFRADNALNLGNAGRFNRQFDASGLKAETEQTKDPRRIKSQGKPMACQSWRDNPKVAENKAWAMWRGSRRLGSPPSIGPPALRP
jgi:hypothetical protein